MPRPLWNHGATVKNNTRLQKVMVSILIDLASRQPKSRIRTCERLSHYKEEEQTAQICISSKYIDQMTILPSISKSLSSVQYSWSSASLSASNYVIRRSNSNVVDQQQRHSVQACMDETQPAGVRRKPSPTQHERLNYLLTNVTTTRSAVGASMIPMLLPYYNSHFAFLVKALAK